MKINEIMLFAYDFPHKKTQDFIFRLLVDGYKIKYIIGAPYKKLNVSVPSIRISPVHEGLIHPRKICEKFGIKYEVMEHNSAEAGAYLDRHQVDLYVISGARILSDRIIASSKNKVLNIHPGLLPEARGLDTLLWSICYDIPIGITSHFISNKIDKGVLIKREVLELKKDDTLLDISLRLLEKQSDVLSSTLEILRKIENFSFSSLDELGGKYFKKMPEDIEKETIKKFSRWLAKHRKE